MRFGTAGIPHSAKKKTTVEGIIEIKNLGLNALEVQFVRGVKMSEESAKVVRDVAKERDVVLSVHAPYYINLNATDKEKLEKSINWLIKTCKIASVMNAKNVVFHAAYYGKLSRETTYRNVLNALKTIREKIDDKIILRPETTGKPSQFGDLDEIIRISSELDGVMPCIDFSHIHARYRVYNSYSEFVKILERIENELGSKAIKDMHIHLSGIEYGLKGEKRHLNLNESDMKYQELLKALIDYEADGVLICESPNLERDALLLKNTYLKILKNL